MKTAYAMDGVFAGWFVRRIIHAPVAPAVISQLVITLSGPTDTSFTGKSGSDAAKVAVPAPCAAMLILNTSADLFGIRGNVWHFRSPGRKDSLRATRTAAFSLWGTMVFSPSMRRFRRFFSGGFHDLLMVRNRFLRLFAHIYTML